MVRHLLLFLLSFSPAPSPHFVITCYVPDDMAIARRAPSTLWCPKLFMQQKVNKILFAKEPLKTLGFSSLEIPSVTLFIYKIVLFVYKLHCLISQSTWKFDQNGTNTKCCQYPRLQPLIAEKALDILAEPQSQPKCKKDIFK